ncbi:hypothetical protein BJ912DRAFT_928979 [Pholiota molesta]|nr:hypothetical protein BJ912DRAFT_928979 [Pholiota molesta]
MSPSPLPPHALPIGRAARVLDSSTSSSTLRVCSGNISSQDAINDVHRSTDLQISIWFDFRCRCGMRLDNCHELLEHNAHYHPHDSSHWHGAIHLPAAFLPSTSESEPSPSPTSSESSPLSPFLSTSTIGTSTPVSSASSTPNSEFRVYTPFSSHSDPGAPTYGYDIGEEIGYEDRLAYAWAGGAKALGLPHMASVLRVDEEEIVARMAIAGMIGDRFTEEDRMRRLASPPPRISTRRSHHTAESTAAREAAKKAKKAASSKARRQVQSAARQAAKLEALAAKQPERFTCQWRGLGCPKSYNSHSGINYHHKLPERCAFAHLAFPSASSPVPTYIMPTPAPSAPSSSSGR